MRLELDFIHWRILFDLDYLIHHDCFLVFRNMNFELKFFFSFLFILVVKPMSLVGGFFFSFKFPLLKPLKWTYDSWYSNTNSLNYEFYKNSDFVMYVYVCANKIVKEENFQVKG